MEYPFGVFIVDGVAVAQPVDHVHGVVKAEQTLSDAVAGAVPGGVDLLGGIHADGILLNTKGHGAVFGLIAFRLVGLQVYLAFPVLRGGIGGLGRGSLRLGFAAASGHDTGEQKYG